MICVICKKDLDRRSNSGYCRNHYGQSCKGKGNIKLKGQIRSQISLICRICKEQFNTYKSREKTKSFCSKKCYNKSLIGIKLSPERILKSALGHSGEKSHFWKGGITAVNKIIRGSFKYKLWREAVFKRDNYTCVWCNIRSGNGKAIILHADHIKSFSLFPELRFVINNGRTLCIDCHKKTDTYLWKIKNYATSFSSKGGC